ncbi:MAG: TRAP transporter large permease subunit, partial [Flavobacteriaceae bacterium]|nr:TRAP transporter large permease subunit [Flavobacteriaceae bacterium]
MTADTTQATAMTEEPVVPEDLRDPSEDRWGSMPRLVRAVVLLASAAGVGMAVGYIFALFPLLDLTYYFLLMAAFLPVVYLLLPAWKGEKGVTWASYLPALAILFLSLVMAWNSRQLVFGTWVPVKETWQLWVALGLFLLILDAARRSGGWIFLAIVVVLSLYPVYAFNMPGIFWGPPTSFARTVAFNVFSNDAMLGVVTRVVAETLIGFLVLAALMVATGAAEFFLNLALSMMGTARGGPAKVAVLASGFFGSLSGSIFSNVVGTGSVTIPAMKKAGFPPHYA